MLHFYLLLGSRVPSRSSVQIHREFGVHLPFLNNLPRNTKCIFDNFLCFFSQLNLFAIINSHCNNLTNILKVAYLHCTRKEHSDVPKMKICQDLPDVRI